MLDESPNRKAPELIEAAPFEGAPLSEPEILLPGKMLSVVAIPHPFTTENVYFEVPEGSSILEILELTQPDPYLRSAAHVFIGDHYILPQFWSKVRPKAGMRVSIRIVPRGGSMGGAKGILRIFMLIAVVAASFIIPGLLPASITGIALLGSGAAALTVGGIIQAGTLLIGGLLVNMLAPPPKASIDKLSGNNKDESPTLFIHGSRNQFNPFGCVPRVLGKFRMIPPYAASPFSETQGNNQYVRMMFTYGYGPLVVTLPKIGETDLADFEEVETDFRRGYQDYQITNKGTWSTGSFPSFPLFGDRWIRSGSATVDGVSYVTGDTITFNALGSSVSAFTWDKNEDKPISLYTFDTNEEAIDITLAYPSDAVALPAYALRTSAPGANELSVDIVFVNGLLGVDNSSGKHVAITVSFSIEYSIANANSWTVALAPAIVGKQQSALIQSFRWYVPPAQYDIRIRRTTKEFGKDNIVEEAHWTAIRTIIHQAPVNMHGLCVTTMRIKATDQLQGTVDQYNAVVSSILRDWNGSSWGYRESASPAACFLEVLTGAANARPLEDQYVHYTSLQDWTTFCNTKAYTFNMIRDFVSSVSDTLDDICNVGRASKILRDGRKWGVVIDQPQTVPTQHFTPRNSWGFSGKRNWPVLPDGFRVKFSNASKNWVLDERIVYDDGFDQNNATKFETLDMPGITNAAQIWTIGRFHIAQQRLRMDEYSFNADVEYIVCQRGDLVLLTHDVLTVGIAVGRINQIVVDGSSNVIQVVLDEIVDMEYGLVYGVSIRTVSNNKLTAQVVTVPGSTNILTFTTPILAANSPALEDLLAFGTLGQETINVLVKLVDPSDNEAAQIVCFDYAPGVYTADNDIPDYISTLTLGPEISYPAVTSMRSDEFALIINPDHSWINQILISLGFAGRRPASVIGIHARFRPAGTNNSWQIVNATATAAQIALPGVQAGAWYEFQLQFVLNGGINGPWGPLLTHLVIGPNGLPAAPTNLRYTNDNLLYWDYFALDIDGVVIVPPPDLLGFKVRYQNGISTNWATAIAAHVGTVASTPYNISAIPPGTVTILVKAIDIAGNESATAASVVRVSVSGGGAVQNALETIDYQAGGFAGTKTNCTVVSGHLVADSLSLFWTGNSNLFWHAPADLFWVGVFAEMTYLFVYNPAVTVGANDKLQVVITALGASYSLEYKIAPSTIYNPMPGLITGIVDADYTFRLIIPGGTIQGDVSVLKVIMGADTISENVPDTAISSAGTTRLPLLNTYRSLIAVNLNVRNAGLNANIDVADLNPTSGPLIKVYNTSNALINATVGGTIYGVRAS